MKGAREYSGLFKTGQYGKLYLTVGRHARGNYFHIQVLPEDESAIPNGESNKCVNVNAVEVYGIIGGNPGWTEEYGWLHKGKWQKDFAELVAKRAMEIDTEKKERVEAEAEAIEIQKKRTKELLENY